MRCLTEIEVQAVADGEADEAIRAHAAGCAACAARVEDVRRALAEVSALVETSARMPAQLESRVRESVASASVVRGSTTLRGVGAAPAWRRPRVLLPLATAAIIALMVFGLLPRFGGSPTTLSASQILGRSIETLTSATGVEFLDYEISADGLARGSWRVQLIVDHERPARFRARTLGPDGEVHSEITQDPVTQRRMQLARVDGRNYIVNVTPVPNPMLSMPQMAQALAETAITMMQATGDPQLTIQEGQNGRQYVIEMPPVPPANSATTLDLHRARVVVSASDYRIQEFEAAGAILRQPFSISVRLITHSIAGEVSGVDGMFTIEPKPEDVVIEGIAADHPFDELFTSVIRELARSRAF